MIAVEAVEGGADKLGFHVVDGGDAFGGEIG